MTNIDEAAVASWRADIGRSETRSERLEHESLRRFALAIGADGDIERIQPVLAHWAFFLPRPADNEIGADGHAHRGGFLPPVTLPRRMYAGATISFEAPLQLGDDSEMVSSIADVSHKRGRSGDLVIVEVASVISQQGKVCLREQRRYVYRESDGGDPAPMPVPRAEPIDGERWMPDAVNLFRFSAATFNAHRIHYDVPYAQAEEGYPALVVHGPFTAARLAELAARQGAVKSFDFRAQAPLFLGQPIFLQQGDGEVRALRCDGVTAVTAKASY